MSSAFIGTWDYESSENFDEFLKDMGLNFMLRKMAASAKPKVTISRNGEKWIIKTVTPVRTIEINAAEGEEFNESKRRLIFKISFLFKSSVGLSLRRVVLYLT
jgi:hypothetical protein